MGWIAPVAPEVARAAHAAVVDKFRIHCPFQQKDEAKALGARWSGTHKTWYAPNQETYDQLAKWHEPAAEPPAKTPKKSKFPGGKTADKAWTTMLAADDEDEHLFSSPAKKLKKCHAALVHKTSSTRSRRRRLRRRRGLRKSSRCGPRACPSLG